MSVTAIITNVQPLSELGITQVRGTVAGTPHTYHKRGLINPTGLLGVQPQGLANEFVSHYNLFAAAVAVLASQTVNVPSGNGSATVAVVFSSTPVAEVGNNYVEITATVNGTANVKSQMTMERFLQVYNESLNTGVRDVVSLLVTVGKLLYQQYTMNNMGSLYIATFTV